MFEALLCPTDGSDGATRILDLATEHGATVHLLSAADIDAECLTGGRTDVAAEIESRARAVVSEAARRAEARGVDFVTTVERAAPVDAIVEHAEAAEIDPIAMPTHGRTGIDRYRLGSVTETLLRTSSVPVLTVRESERPDGE